jgi:hypothetical protein
MAKFIKCPTCATPIEVNPQAMGQIVKCPGCGKGIKLVAKKSAGSPSQSAGGGGNAGASVAGHSETMRSFMGEPAINDDPPRLDTTCARCGNSVDEVDLVEDEGELVCKECAIAAAAERSAGAMEDYAPAPYVPSRRGSLINLNLLFFVFCFFALLFGGSEAYLRFVPVPQGKKVSQGSLAPVRPKGPSAFATTSATPSPTEVVSTTQATELAQEKADAEWEQANKDAITMRFNKANQALAEGKKDEAEALYKDAFSFIEGHKLKDTLLSSTVATAAKLWDSLHARPAPASQETIATAPPPAPPAPGTTEPAPAEGTAPSNALPSNPLVAGLQKLNEKDYEAAARSLEEARRRLIYGPVTGALTSDQALVLVAKAAADIGRGKPEDGRPAVDLAYKNNIRTRAAVLNRATIYLASAPGHASIKDFIDAVESVRKLVDSEQLYDELGSNVLGTLLDRLINMNVNPATRTDLITRQKALDAYNDRFVTEHEAKMKWGIEWLPADDVKRYRLLKGSVQDAALSQLNRELELAKAKVVTAQKSVDRGVSDAGKQLETANAALKAAQEKVDMAKQAVPPQHWLEKFEPVIPDETPKS